MIGGVVSGNPDPERSQLKEEEEVNMDLHRWRRINTGVLFIQINIGTDYLDRAHLS